MQNPGWLFSQGTSHRIASHRVMSRRGRAGWTTRLQGDRRDKEGAASMEERTGHTSSG